MQMCKKKILLVVCYLLVIVGLITTTSWARYKKEINAEIIVAEAADFRASMQLSGDSAVKENLIVQLTELRPGETAEDNYHSKRHGMEFTVNNAEITQQGTAVDTSDKPIGYTLRIYGKGNMPLSLVLYDQTNKEMYPATRNVISGGYMYTFEDVENNVIQKEHEFSLKEKEYDDNTFVLYLGWQGSGENEDYDDRKYMKEVELLEIRAVVRARSTGMEEAP